MWALDESSLDGCNEKKTKNRFYAKFLRKIFFLELNLPFL